MNASSCTGTGSAPRTLVRRAAVACRVNDVHSELNATNVSRIVSPRSVSELQEAVLAAARTGSPVSVCGARHAMGGQQFGTGGTLIDTTRLNRVIAADPERGLLTVEAGIDWRRLMSGAVRVSRGELDAWGIVQKQTGADHLTIGGALAANIHGRGLRLRPIVGDVERFELVDACGALVPCSRTENRSLFSLAIGGYGLFGPIARVTLRLARRRKLERRVTIASTDDLPRLFDERIQGGFEFGDYQFATDPHSREFLRKGVFACYRPVHADTPMPDRQRALSTGEWKRLMHLAHTDKSRAFAEYARYYLATDGQLYWSDTHQLSRYPEAYHAELDRVLGARSKGSEMITELYVPRSCLPEFMRAARADARQHAFHIIYGTVRLIERDDESFLAWAREPWACVVFNLHVDHTPDGLDKAALDFRRLIDRALQVGGSYYLTYHRWATAEQVRAAHPRMMQFLGEKRRYDPSCVFRSDWHTHHERLLGGEA